MHVCPPEHPSMRWCWNEAWKGAYSEIYYLQDSGQRHLLEVWTMRTKQQLQHLGERHSRRPWKKGKGPCLSTIWVCSNYSVTVFRKILEIYHQYVWLQTTRVKGREQKWLLVRNELLYQQGSSIKSAPHISFWSRRLTNNGPKWRLNVRNMRDGEAASKKRWFSYSKCNDVQWKRERCLYSCL